MTAPRCTNEEHPTRPAVVNVVWPDGRFKPGPACVTCMRTVIGWYVIGHEDGTQHPVLIEPLPTVAT